MRNLSSFSANPCRRGVMIIAILLVLSLLLAVGLIYYRSSLDSTVRILHRAEFLKARNLARAALEKALVVLETRYREGERGYKFEGQGPDQTFFQGETPAGRWEVRSILPVTRLAVSPDTQLQEVFVDRPYILGTGRSGTYDLLDVRCVGQARDIHVKLDALVKVIREEVRY